MASLTATLSCAVGSGGLRTRVTVGGSDKTNCYLFKTSFLGSSLSGLYRVIVSFERARRRAVLLPQIRCEKDEFYKEVTVERYPYHVYMDSTSGQLEPASGARTIIPDEKYWPEGTTNRVRAARAPEPTGKSLGSPSYGKKPGSRRKKYKTSAASSDSPVANSKWEDEVLVAEAASDHSTVEVESSGSGLSDQELGPDDSREPAVSVDVAEEPKDESSEYVIYQTEVEEEETGYELDKMLGRPHPFVDPKTKTKIEEPLTSEELWWNWRKPEKEQWSRWQRRRPDVETVFLKAMAETGQVKLYGDEPTLTETSLYRARRHLFKEERLQAEEERLEGIGPMAYYSEWVKAWKRDTSREAVQKHFEETGEDENTQLIEMFCHQTDREYRIMMGTDIRIRRDPLAMRMREDQIKQIWGGDPVYPTINYIQDPNEVIDYRGPDFHEPTPNMIDFLKEHGKLITREELNEILAKEKTTEVEMTDMDEAMARAVDIGENDDEGEESELEGDAQDEKFSRNWSAMRSNPALYKQKDKQKKGNSMSLDDAVDNSENLTDFLLDFEEDE
ncbi:hypothetical protein MLD38_016676 [Melastoma candidum]|uniref:Uncharacterized protein n=1 Tax=Melastoma candidum TaxID=119954 RepID=A0ACB9QS72_9MYRT|nr:hypothetical protein MLD38_016676 [Melastoma candidum]